MMKVVIPFSKGDQSGDEVVSRRSAIIEGLLSQPMCERIDAECGLLDEARSDDTCVDEPSPPIAPS